MAARKKQALTPKKRLETALVPESEWPCRVPGNWCWVRLGTVAEIVTGNTPSKKRPEYYGEQIPFFKPADLDAGRHVWEATECLSSEGGKMARLVPAQSTAVCCIGSIGKCGYLETAGATNQQINSVIPRIDSLYMYYYLSSELYTQQLLSKSSATTIAIVNKGKMANTTIPVPPLHEQRRIVSRIEWLFSKLDDAEAELREVIEQSEQRQAAILHKAFSGDYSAMHAEKHDWPVVEVGTIVSGLKYGTSEKCAYDNCGTPVLRIPNVSKLFVNLDDMKRLPHSKVKPADLLQAGDILMIRSNGSRDLVGRCAVVPQLEEDYTYASFLIRIRPSSEVDPQFLWYYLQSPDAKAQLFNRAKSSSGIHNINSKEIAATKIPLPEPDEQLRIASVLDDLLETERASVEKAVAAIEGINVIRQSILTKALRGELGTNDPSEPSSKELLSELLAAK